jgi:hypothetical protein
MDAEIRIPEPEGNKTLVHRLTAGQESTSVCMESPFLYGKGKGLNSSPATPFITPSTVLPVEVMSRRSMSASDNEFLWPVAQRTIQAWPCMCALPSYVSRGCVEGEPQEKEAGVDLGHSQECQCQGHM